MRRNKMIELSEEVKMSEEKSCTEFSDNYYKLDCDDLRELYEEAILNCVDEMQARGDARVFGSDIATIGFFVNRYKGE